MKNETTNEIKRLIEREEISNETEEEFIETLLNKFRDVSATGLPEYNCVQKKEIVYEINLFVGDSETQRRKLALFCQNFSDPTVPQTIISNGEEIQLNKFLHEDDLYKLVQLVKRHKNDKPFDETVIKIMKEHGIEKNSQIYASAYMSRQDFSKAINSKNPSKNHVWQIIIGLKCSLEEADEVLFSAGYVRRKNVLDIVMQYFIERKNYDIMAINEVLAELGQKLFTLDKAVKDSDPFD